MSDMEYAPSVVYRYTGEAKGDNVVRTSGGIQDKVTSELILFLFLVDGLFF
jgi:hypothetical protein